MGFRTDTLKGGQTRRQGMRSASADIAWDLVRALQRRNEQARVALPLRLADELLDDLERLNLAGRRRVPREWEGPITHLMAALPDEGRELPMLRTNVHPTRLMDSLYELEDWLLDLKVGPFRAKLRDLDAELFDAEELPVGNPDRRAVA